MTYLGLCLCIDPCNTQQTSLQRNKTHTNRDGQATGDGKPRDGDGLFHSLPPPSCTLVLASSFMQGVAAMDREGAQIAWRWLLFGDG